MKDDPEVDLPGTQEEVEKLTVTKTRTERKKKKECRNDKELAIFTLAFETDDLLNLVVEAHSEEWPDVLA